MLCVVDVYVNSMSMCITLYFSMFYPLINNCCKCVVLDRFYQYSYVFNFCYWLIYVVLLFCFDCIIDWSNTLVCYFL